VKTADHHPASALCPICRARALLRDARTAQLSVTRCPSCLHRVAEHRQAGASPSSDYHEQYDQSDFLRALERTRLRQASRIVQLLRRNFPGPFSLLDFGAGRGWFLAEARRAGVERLAGVDTSGLSVKLLREHGFEALQLPPASSGEPLPTLSFRPDVLTFLDVIEHFPANEVAQRLAKVLRHFRPRLAVIKVPISSGLLYRSARVLARCGGAAVLEQLYQVGTLPPHFSYFSRQSLKLLLPECGLELIDDILDLDFEGEDLHQRAGALKRLGIAARGIGAVASVGARAFGLEDSLIVVARFNALAQS
jgi:2-polyprenyl-3-methyl-5-hydroxy-6-metoxy-1,4-benzoquinol methylase